MCKLLPYESAYLFRVNYFIRSLISYRTLCMYKVRTQKEDI